MHTFQTYPSDMFEIDPFTKIGSDWMLITSGNKEKANALTASWGGLGFLWGKNVAFIFIRKSRYTKEFIDNGETFSMTFFDKKYKNDLKYFGAVSGRQEDKFKTSGLNLNYHNDVPFVDEGNLAFICKKMAAVPIINVHVDKHIFGDWNSRHFFTDKCKISFIKDMFIDLDIDEKWYSKANLDDYHTMYIGEITDILAR